MKYLFTLALLLAQITLTLAQTFWVDAEIDSNLGESHDIIRSADGGFLASGGDVQKYDAEGNLEWSNTLPDYFGGVDNIGTSIVEGEEAIFIGEVILSLGLTISSITEYTPNGTFRGRNEFDGFEINKLLMDAEGMLYAFLHASPLTLPQIRLLNLIKNLNNNGKSPSLMDKHQHLTTMPI